MISFIIKWERAILFWKLILIGWKHSMRKIWPAFKYSFKATSPRHLNEYFNESRPWFCFTDEIKIYQTFYWPVICMIESNSKWEVIDCPCEWYIKKPFLHQDEDLPWFSYMTSNVSLLIHLNNTLAYILYRRGQPQSKRDLFHELQTRLKSMSKDKDKRRKWKDSTKKYRGRGFGRNPPYYSKSQ